MTVTPRYARDQATLRKHPQVVARIDAATDSQDPQRDAHVRQVALTVLRAKGLSA